MNFTKRQEGSTQMRTILWHIYFWSYMLFRWPVQRKGLKQLRAGNWEASDRLAEQFVPDWANRMMRKAGVTIETYGQENIPKDRPCVFVANHRSYYDIPVLLTQLDKPHALISKTEIGMIPLVRGWMEMLHCVFLDRNDNRKAMAALKEATENLKKGYSISIFPEGTRNKGEEGTVQEFKGGAFRVATKAKAPIVPVAITGTRDIMENNHMFMRPAHVIVRILPPIETDGMTREEIKALPELAREQIRQNLEPNYKAAHTAEKTEQ